MIEAFKKNLIEIGLSELLDNNSTDSTVLLAVSGGVDSMVMSELFYRLGIDCVIVHCNFQLRGTESDEDELHVCSIAEQYNFNFHVKRFETIKYSTEHGISAQMAARDLRYSYFADLVNENNYKFIATAHNKEDVAETMLLNLIRGTGIAGMHGIAPISKKLIRPLLFAGKNELIKYAKDQKLLWREDSSNVNDNYYRNKIRNKVFPILEEINPSVANAFKSYASLISKYEILIDDFIAEFKPEIVVKNTQKGSLKISLSELLKHKQPDLILYHLLKEYGFNFNDCSNMINSNRDGSLFYSGEFKIIRSRGELFLNRNLDRLHEMEFCWNKDQKVLQLELGTLEMNLQNVNAHQAINELYKGNSLTTAFIDADKISFPLKVRRWHKSDYFYPLGMKGRKLLSDFFTDNKFNPYEKENVYLLISDDKIVWVVGHRTDDRFKITGETTKIMKLKWQENLQNEK